MDEPQHQTRSKGSRFCLASRTGRRRSRSGLPAAPIGGPSSSAACLLSPNNPSPHACLVAHKRERESSSKHTVKRSGQLQAAGCFSDRVGVLTWRPLDLTFRDEVLVSADPLCSGRSTPSKGRGSEAKVGCFRPHGLPDVEPGLRGRRQARGRAAEDVALLLSLPLPPPTTT